MDVKKLLILLGHALVGWALCAATMGIGMAVAPIDVVLIVHAIGAPIFFAGVSLVYFSRFNYTTPLQTATAFVAVVIAMDFFVVGLAILHSLEMFTSLLGTWIPFALIFLSTYLTGWLVRKRTAASNAA